MVKYKVAEQRIIGKYCNCNSFGVTMDLLTRGGGGGATIIDKKNQLSSETLEEIKNFYLVFYRF